MEQRDLLKEQIEQLGKVLAKILSNFVGLKSKEQVGLAIENTNQQLKSELDIDIEKLLSLPKNELMEYLQKRKLTAEHMEVLSDYFTEAGNHQKENNPPDAQQYYTQAIALLDMANVISQQASFIRINKRSAIEQLLK